MSVDRSQLREQIALASDDDESFEKLTPLAKELRASILTRGPITVAEFMRLCLTHDKYGYYIQGDVFGSKGDFTTSPEISQVMFGFFGALGHTLCPLHKYATNRRIALSWTRFAESPVMKWLDDSVGYWCCRFLASSLECTWTDVTNVLCHFVSGGGVGCVCVPLCAYLCVCVRA